LTDDEFTAVSSQFNDKLQTDARGTPIFRLPCPRGAAAKPLEAKVVVMSPSRAGGRSSAS